MNKHQKGTPLTVEHIGIFFLWIVAIALLTCVGYCIVSTLSRLTGTVDEYPPPAYNWRVEWADGNACINFDGMSSTTRRGPYQQHCDVLLNH